MSEKLYHIGLGQDDIAGAQYAILPGDPGRVPKIARFLDDAVQIGQNREYTSYLGKIKGQNVLVMSTGMGGPSTAIAVEELNMLGVKTLIRVGTSGGMQMEIVPGDSVIVNGAIRQEGTSREYLPIEYPAVADFEVTAALKQAAETLGFNHHIGVAQCKDSYYGQHDPARMPVADELESKWKAWVRGGALVSEMETAALFSVCSYLRLKAGAVMLCVWNQERRAAGVIDSAAHDTEQAIKIAIEGISNLIG